MSKPRLVVDQSMSVIDRYNVAWFIDGDIGLQLGDDGGEDEEHRCATEAARPMASGTKPGRPLEFESASKARAAIRAANLALKALRDNRPMPDWALKATAAGWRPPKGWKP